MTINQTTTDHCTHGGDCPIHPDARGLHDYDVAEMRAELEQWRATFGETALRNAQQVLADRDALRAERDRLHEQYAAAHQALRSLALAYVDATGKPAPVEVPA